MNKHSLKIWVALLAACAMFIAANAVIGRAAAPAADTAAPDYCAASFKNAKGETIASKYNDENMGLEDVMSGYHAWVNKSFNDYILEMVKSESAAAKSGQPDPRGDPPGPVKDGEPALKPCPASEKENYSPYCLAQKILTNEREGYLAYMRALDCRRSQVFDTKAELISYTDVLETAMSGGIANPAVTDAVAEPVYQTQKAVEISARLEAIDREKSKAMRAVDQSLAAYNELRTAWPMHQKYIQIYKDLIIYRDKMVEIRNQVEEFPAKFIDASTTKCT